MLRWRGDQEVEDDRDAWIAAEYRRRLAAGYAGNPSMLLVELFDAWERGDRSSQHSASLGQPGKVTRSLVRYETPPTVRTTAATPANDERAGAGLFAEATEQTHPTLGDFFADILDNEQRTRNAQALRVADSDRARRKVIEGQLLEIADILALDPWGLEIVVDKRAAARLGAAGARGQQEGTTIYLHPDVYDPRGEEGRYLLAHEMVHAKQRTLRSDGDGAHDVSHAEAEANDLGRSYARGAGLSAPTVALRNTAPANDSPNPAEDKLLATPPTLSRAVHMIGIKYTPQADAKWIGGIDKRKQAFAAFLFDLVGPKYNVALLNEALAAQPSVFAEGHLQGRATQNDKIEPFYAYTRVAMRTLAFLKTKGIAHNLTAEQVSTLERGLDAQDTWPHLREHKDIPPWFTEQMYMLMMKAEPAELTAYGKAAHTYLDDKTAANLKAVDVVRERVVKLLMNPAGNTVEIIRKDTSLASEPGYRVLWGLPAPTPNGPAVEVKVGPDGPASLKPCTLLLAAAKYDDKDIALKAAGSRPARVTLLKNMIRRLGEMKEPTEGDEVLRDAPIRATKPPLPSSLRAWPALEAPFFDTPKGGDREFVMSVGFPDVFEAFRGYQYKWELMEVPDEDVKKLGDYEDPRDKAAKTADNKWISGAQPGQLDVLGGRLARDAEYGRSDIKRSISSLSSILGSPGLGATTLVTANAMLRMVGTVIRAFIETLTKPRNEKSMPFAKEGLYIVRCTSWPSPIDNAVIDRAPSVSWMPVWVRPTQDMAALRVNLDSKIREGALIQYKAIEDALNSAAMKDPANKTQRDALEKQRDILKTTLWGNAGEQLELEKKQLAEALAKTKDAAEQKRMQERIDAIDDILKKRADRMKGAPAPGSGLEAPFRIPSAFVAHTGQTMRLQLEAFQLKGPKGKLTYKVVDSTTKKSGFMSATAGTREEAIQNAVVELLETGAGYGRGNVTLNIPNTPDGKPVTLEITKSLGGIVMESIENLTTVATIAAIALAPMTGGASLALMVPIAVAGAVPSAYRLLERAEMGTLSFDMETAMDVVNILGAAVSAGTARAASIAALRGVPISTGYMILGLGNDGLGFMVAAASFMQGIAELDKDPTMPKGLRNARIAEMVGQQMIQVGIMAGASLVSHGKAEQARFGGRKAAEPVGPRVGPDVTAKFHEAVGPKGADIPVFRDTTGKQVAGDGVHIVFERDGYGLPVDARIIMGPGATETHLLNHVNAAKAVVEYQGFFGWLRNLKDKVAVLFGGKPPTDTKTRAGLAAIEIDKISGVIAKMTDDLGHGTITREAYDSKLKDYKEQIATHEQSLNDFSKGPGLIAAHDNVTKAAQKAGYPTVAGHYYIDTGDGRYQLMRSAGSTEPGKHIEFKGGKPVLANGDFKGKLYNKTAIQELAKPLGKNVTLVDNVNLKEVSVRPQKDGSYEVHYKRGTSEAAIKEAIDRHLELRAQRPKDLNEPYKKDGTRWTGADEAEYLGRPTEDGYHWALADGKLQIVTEDPKKHPKKIWDDTKGKPVIDTGAPKPEPKFDAKMGGGNLKKAKADAFEILGGNNPKTEFGAWVKKAKKYLDLSKADLIARMGDPQGKNHDTVRGHVKDGVSGKDDLTKKMVQRIALDKDGKANDRAFLRKQQPDAYKGVSGEADLKKADKVASHAELLELTEGLGSGDRGSMGELWYHANYEPKAERHVVFEKEATNKQGGVGLTETRKPDIVGKTKINEIKHTNGSLGPRDRAEIEDYTKLLGRKIEADGKTYNLTEMAVVFPEPAGGNANAKYISELVSDKRISVEIFNSKGEKKTITNADLKKGGKFNPGGGEEGLIKAIKAWAE
jgi:hypothetical protein